MKKLNLLILAIFMATSCQATQEPQIERNTTSQEYQEKIKTEKKRQAEVDLPFRGFPLDEDITRLSFASCADQDKPQPIWASIEKNQPQLMIMLGDNIYASKKEQKPISEQYAKLNKISEYRSVREKVPFMATWDDHDFGQNDGGETNEEKFEAKTQFIKNWPYVKNLISESQTGIYHSKTFGQKKNILQVIMLDTRFGRSDLKKNEEQSAAEKLIAPKPFLPDDNPNKKILAEDQWNWLEKELKKPAAFRIISSSIQVIANDHQFEKWGNFPHERERFFKLLKKLKIKNAIILSGDRHMSAIAKYEIKGLGPIYEVTASAINRPARPGNNLIDASYLAEGYGQVNFGYMDINWQERKANIEIKSLENEKVQNVEVKF